MPRFQTAAMREVMSEHKRCELCGSSRSLEAHHIIPVTLGGTEEKENILCVCKKCHALLTPNSLLTKLALRPRNCEDRFWKHFDELAEAAERVDAVDVMNYVETEIFPVLRATLSKSKFEKE